MRYYSQGHQLTIEEFKGALSRLPKDNRWVKLGDSLPWDRIEKVYVSKLKNEKTGAALSLVLPSYLVILIVSHFMEKFKDSPLVNHVFYGIRPATAGLIAGAMFEVFLLSLFDVNAFQASGSVIDLIRIVPVAVYVMALLCVVKLPKVHPIVFIIAGAVLGIVLGL